MLQDSARVEDIVCRYGGEEFLLVLPKMPLDTARMRGQQLLRLFENALVSFGDHRIRVTTSIGIAGTPLYSNSAEGLIRCADEALYLAKHNGRNRVVTFGDASSELRG